MWCFFLLPRSLEKALKKQAKAKAEEQNPEQWANLKDANLKSSSFDESYSSMVLGFSDVNTLVLHPFGQEPHWL